jgi:hypothetical protein
MWREDGKRGRTVDKADPLLCRDDKLRLNGSTMKSPLQDVL